MRNPAAGRPVGRPGGQPASGPASGSSTTPASAGDLLVPFTLELSPIRQLLIIDVADDPTYRTLEPQTLDGPDGAGLVLLAYRHDGQVELYAEPTLSIDPSGYDGLGACTIHRTEFDASRFEVTPDGLRLDVAFTAPNRRRVDLHIHEHLTRGRDQFPALAPVGGAFTTPAFFPFLWLPGLSFVPVRGTEVTLRVDGKPRTISRLPLPLGGRRCLMARYDPDVMVCQVNPDQVSDLSSLSPDGQVRDESMDVGVVDVDGHPALAGVRVRRGDHDCALRVDPPLVDLRQLPRGVLRQGVVDLLADGVTELQGRYSAQRQGDQVEVLIDGIGPWRTRQRRPLLAVLFRLPIFRRWPTTYRWRATFDLTGDPALSTRLTSRWTREQG